MTKKIQVLHGPNLNMLGKRDANLYGSDSLSDIEKQMSIWAKNFKFKLDYFQSNHEGEIIDVIQKASQQFDALIINPGAFTHYSYAIRDALELIHIPKIEVHLSHIYQREDFRHLCVTSAVCDGQITGFGKQGYLMALTYLNERLN